MSPENIINRLIQAEVSTRKKVWELRREMPKNLSKAPIKLMYLVLEKKKLDYTENLFLSNKIEAFDLSTR